MQRYYIHTTKSYNLPFLNFIIWKWEVCLGDFKKEEGYFILFFYTFLF